MKYSVAIFVALALAFGAWYAASPYYALSGLRDAVEAGDAQSIEDRVNFDSLRASIKSEFKSKLNEQASKEDANPLLATAGLALADRFIDGMLDTMMTPDGIARLIKISKEKAENVDGVANQASANSNENKFDDWEVERIGFSEFRLSNPKDDKTPTLIFYRDGLGWKLSDIDMTNTELPSL